MFSPTIYTTFLAQMLRFVVKTCLAWCYTWPTGPHDTARHYVALPCCLALPCPTLSPGMALCLLSRAHRHGSPPWSCRPVARREETRSSPSQAVSPRVTNTPSLSNSSAPLRPRMGVEACSCCAASQLGVLACLFRFRLDVEMRPTRGAGRVLCMRALVH